MNRAEIVEVLRSLDEEELGLPHCCPASAEQHKHNSAALHEAIDLLSLPTTTEITEARVAAWSTLVYQAQPRTAAMVERAFDALAREQGLVADNERLTNALLNDGALIEAHTVIDSLESQIAKVREVRAALPTFTLFAEFVEALDVALANDAGPIVRPSQTPTYSIPALPVNPDADALVSRYATSRETSTLSSKDAAWAHGVVDRLRAPASAPGEFWTTLRVSTGGRRGYRAFIVDADGRTTHPLQALGEDHYEQDYPDPMMARDMAEVDGRAQDLPEWKPSATNCPRCGRLACACTSVVP